MTDTAIQNETLDLSLSLGSRLCHDLISPFGAIANGVELLQMGAGHLAGSPEMQLVAEAVEAARARLQTFRVAFGQVRGEQRISGPDLGKLVGNMAAQSKMTIEVDTDADHARADVQMLLLAIMCMESALPWGGKLLIVRNGTRWRLVAQADRVKAEPDLWAWLSGEGKVAPAPAKVHFALLSQAAQAAERKIQWELDETGAEIIL